MQFMASNKSTLSKLPWQRSLDSQEFGFASNLMESFDVAPADELFFKGQLLPLHVDHRLHLVQALSSSSSSCPEQSLHSSMATARAEGSSRLSYSHDLCQEDDVIEFNSYRLKREVSLKHLKGSMQSSSLEDDKHMQCLQSSSPITRDEKLKNFSSKSKSFSELDFGVCTGNRTANGNGEHGMLSSHEGDELHSCNWDLGSFDHKFTSVNDATTDPGSSSFRSQNSGLWDSGTDKDMMDSSSSRDSNGSSQDSYYQATHPHNKLATHPHNKAPSFINTFQQHAHSKSLSFNLPWKLALFKRGTCKKQASAQDPSLTFTKMGFSEDLGKYKASATPPLNEVKEASLPWKLDREADGCKQEAKGSNQQRSSYFSAAIDGCSGTATEPCERSAHICDMDVKKSSVQGGSKSFRILTRGTAMEDEAAKKQGSAAVKERRQTCARRLKPLCEMKRGWMGQLRMDECGRRAYCEVEDGITLVQSARPANGQVQSRLCDEASSSSATMKGSKTSSSQQQKQGIGHSFKVLAMSSCPSSTISSPTHSGVLSSSSRKIGAHSSKTSRKSLNHPPKDQLTAIADAGSCMSNSSTESSGNIAVNGGNNYTSMSTMQELQSALQSAIAHCKDSNKKLDYADYRSISHFRP
ncbi:hypothetical protein L7F22_053279 [Adiantum nelumboides]|nr:hypothetical protein [Adiantum nelumboides]